VYTGSVWRPVSGARFPSITLVFNAPHPAGTARDGIGLEGWC
jgi:hypothetical protein